MSLIQSIAQVDGKQNNNHPNVHNIVIMQVLHTTSYTYVQGAEKDRVVWIAIPKMDAKKGEKYYYQGGMEMKDFKSKELDRTFSSIIFLNGLISPEIVEGGNPSSIASLKKSKTGEKQLDIDIKPIHGGITIAELYRNKTVYANNSVTIKGKVTKFNSGIMGKNWIHLQDGTASSGQYDLTITSDEEVSVGDIITIKGELILDKDFGSGYFYNIIVENGKMIK